MPDTDADAIRAAIYENSLALAKARADAAEFDRLKAAAGEVTRLQREADKLTAAMSKALDTEEAARVLAVADTYRDFRVSAPSTQAGAVVTISYERLRYSTGTRQNEWKRESVEGFHYLDAVVLRYITKHKPSLIPSAILNLAPGNAWDAVQLFITARRRNYM